MNIETKRRFSYYKVKLAKCVLEIMVTMSLLLAKNIKGREVLRKSKKGKEVNVELVKEGGHVEDDGDSMNPRRSNRNRGINKRLTRYELGGELEWVQPPSDILLFSPLIFSLIQFF